jgi:ectoine hydroxylase-related dioxygenase (phytanoyl-CoA dioxygenase family)
MACTAAVGPTPTVPHHRRLLRAISCHVATAASVPPQLQALGDTIPRLWEHSINNPSEVVVHSPWHDVPLFDRMKQPEGGLTAAQREAMDTDGHVVLPGILTEETVERLIERLGAMNELDTRHQRVRAVKREALEATRDDEAATAGARRAAEEALNSWAGDGGLGMRLSVGACIAEHDEYVESCVGHPQMLALARSILGEDIRFDHCCNSSGRAGGDTPDRGMGYHGHSYADGRKTWADEFVPGLAPTTDDPSLGFIRIFFYVNGFDVDNGNLKVVPGSHLIRQDLAHGRDDEELASEWMRGKVHPLTGEPLAIRHLECPRGSVVCMWTHAAHGVSSKPVGSERRWVRRPLRPFRRPF